MASFVKFESFSEKLATGVHNLHTDTLNIYLSNDAPVVATDDEKADVVEITVENGYTGPEDTGNSVSRSGGTTSVVPANDPITITASGSVGPFRYVVLYDDTPAGDPLIGYWDYGAEVTLANGESFTVDFGASLFTIA